MKKKQVKKKGQDIQNLPSKAKLHLSVMSRWDEEITTTLGYQSFQNQVKHFTTLVT